MKSMADKIEEQLINPKELKKNQISVFLKPNKIEELDNLVEKMNFYSEKTWNRNSLIEWAVDLFIEEAPLAIKKHQQKYQQKVEDYNMVIFAARIDGLEVFLKEKCWYWCRISEERIDKLKYIGIYVGSPLHKIQYYAEIDGKPEVKIIDGKKRYKFHFKGEVKQLKSPVSLGNISPLATRAPKYTTLEKLKTAEEFSDLTL